MAVKTIRLRQGENFYEFAERKFGDRSIGNTLIRQFGRGRAGVQYRFRTSLSTSKKAVAGRRQRVATDFAQQQELVTPEIVSEGLIARPEDIQGREAQMAGIEQRVLGTAGEAISGGLGRLSSIEGRSAQMAAIDARTAETMGGIGSLAQQAREQQIETRTQRALGLVPGTGTAGLGGIDDPFAALAQSMAQEPRNPAFSQRLQPTLADEEDPVSTVSGFLSPSNIISSFVDRVSALPSSHPAGFNLGEVKDLAVGLIDKLILGQAPTVIADATARLAFGEGYADDLLLAGYVFNESTGFWEFNSGVATGPGTGGAGMGGGFFGGRRGGGGGGGAARRSVGSFLPSSSNLFNWRVNFG